MSVCHKCWAGVRKLNDEGDCVLTPEWQANLESGLDWDDWPCATCELVDLNDYGNDIPYRRGATFVSLDNMSRGDGLDFEDAAFSLEEMRDIYLPMSTLPQLQGILRSLPPIQRDAVESRFDGGLVSAETIAHKHGVTPQKVRTEFRKAVQNDAFLSSVFPLKGKLARSVNMCIAVEMDELQRTLESINL